ncbi:hypothetical protein Droror1_Dr00025022 [Drosera rotundifolia]
MWVLKAEASMDFEYMGGLGKRVKRKWRCGRGWRVRRVPAVDARGGEEKDGSSDDHGKPATVYKSQKRNELVNDGYRIIGNSGDQWSDLLGYAMSVRSFKLPNPMYYIAWTRDD